MSDSPLSSYRAKRDPSRTPEPFAEPPTSAAANPTAGMFVVQQHSARRMHWDLRLEINGVLVSWAVPRGPSLDPSVKRLAVQTEDHPLEYADFEGVIPAGNYGAGAMIVWDRGSYQTIDGIGAVESLRRGKLDLTLFGHKLQGRWALVRTKGDNGRSWLLLHKGRPPKSAEPELVVKLPASVLSGLSVDDVGRGINQTATLAARAHHLGAHASRVADRDLRPMLAATGASAFTHADWLFELKYDGVRVLASRQPSGSVQLRYRSGRDVTAVFPEIEQAVARLPCDDFVIDGEVIALDERGHTSFERLQRRLGLSNGAEIERARRAIPLLMMCFDLLRVAALDCRPLPLLKRKDLLAGFVPRLGIARYADHIEEQGKVLFAEAAALGLEGVVAKRSQSTYQSGRRSRDWLKLKALRSADLVIVGFTRGKGQRAPLGALLLAWRDGDGFAYAGNVGSGFDAAIVTGLTDRLRALTCQQPACSGIPLTVARRSTWTEPRLLAEVRFVEATSKGLLRQPVFVRVRDDKVPAQADSLRQPRESPPPEAAPRPSGRNDEGVLQLTNRNKIFWPEDGFTKGDLLAYYERIWPYIAPYLRDRPVVLTRYPDGILGKSFFQTNVPDFTPSWVKTQRVDGTDFFLCNDLRTLLYVINSGCIPIHVWSARVVALQRPDWAIVDLDPKGAPFEHVVRLARSLHSLATELKAPHFLKTSGQDGLHILFPLGGALTHHEARTFAEVLSRLIVAENPTIATVARPLSDRGGRVYLDYLQNGYGKTIVAPFSVRPRTGAPVSTPLSWGELSPRLDPRRFTIATVPRRSRSRPDPLRAILDVDVEPLAVLERLRQRFK